MKQKRKGVNIFAGLLAIVIVIVSIFCGGYFFLDKVIVPKYLDKYGIFGMSDLVGVVTSLYKSPKESTLVTNGFTESDLNSAVQKLQSMGYNIKDDGTIDVDDFTQAEGDYDDFFTLTDREFAAVCNKMLESGILVDVLPNLNYLNLINLSVLEIKITPIGSSFDAETGGYNAANIECIIKINDTKDIREHIAIQMGTPKYLLEMIIPDTMYFMFSYDIDLTKTENNRSNGKIAINGRTEKQSEILINLLINFIFPESEKMNLDNFTKALGDIITTGIDKLGDFKFAKDIGRIGNQNGFIVYT